MLTERDNIIHELHKNMSLKIVQRSPDVDIAQLPGLCRKLVACVGSLAYEHEKFDMPIALQISKISNPAGEFILGPSQLPNFILKNCSAENNVIQIDYDGRFVSVGAEFISIAPEASAFSQDNDAFIFFVYARQIHVIINGMGVDFISNASSLEKRARGTELHIDEWPKIVEKYKTALQAQKRLTYWAKPKTKMKLMASPEELFRKDLANFIEQYTIGCIVDQEAFIGDDRTDIRVVTLKDKGSYYFELKCLGKCISGTNYDDKHAQEALTQINVYLNGDNSSVVGVIVIFDGRETKNAIAWPKKMVDDLHKKAIHPPVEIPLAIESASTTAKKVVAAAAKKTGT